MLLLSKLLAVDSCVVQSLESHMTRSKIKAPLFEYLGDMPFLVI